jgi:hypothetical protein
MVVARLLSVVEVLVAVIETGSFVRAAEALGLSPIFPAGSFDDARATNGTVKTSETASAAIPPPRQDPSKIIVNHPSLPCEYLPADDLGLRDSCRAADCEPSP